jgi:hypothetical protein
MAKTLYAGQWPGADVDDVEWPPVKQAAPTLTAITPSSVEQSAGPAVIQLDGTNLIAPALVFAQDPDSPNNGWSVSLPCTIVDDTEMRATFDPGRFQPGDSVPVRIATGGGWTQARFVAVT